MRVRTDRSGVIETSATLAEFFHRQVDAGLERHGHDGPDGSRWYLVQLLCTGARGQRLFEDSDTGPRPPPLAELYRRAVEARTDRARRAELQRLGDLAMLVAGLFAGSLRRRPVKVDYVIGMGGAAYANLAGTVSSHADARTEVFADLAEHFGDYVCALSHIVAPPDAGSGAPEACPASLAARLERWESTRHPARARELRACGVFVEGGDTRH